MDDDDGGDIQSFEDQLAMQDMDDDDGDDDDDIQSFAYHLAMENMRLRAVNDQLTALLTSASRAAARPAAGTGAPGSEEAIQALKEVAITGDEALHQLDCAICLDKNGGAAAAAAWKETPCGHRFHGGCLEKWLRMRGMCPMCRHQMPTRAAPAAPGRVVQVAAFESTLGSLLVFVRVRRSAVTDDNGAAPVEGMDDYLYSVHQIPLPPVPNP